MGSPVTGRALTDFTLPESVRPAAVVRAGHLRECGDCGPLRVGDHVYLFAQATDLPVLDPLFMIMPVPSHLEAGRFFGELALNADADMVELARMYGLSLNPTDAAGTLEHYLRRRFEQPVIGDRVRLGSVEFVVREMRGQRIVKVGMKLRVTEGSGRPGKGK